MIARKRRKKGNKIQVPEITFVAKSVYAKWFTKYTKKGEIDYRNLFGSMRIKDEIRYAWLNNSQYAFVCAQLFHITHTCRKLFLDTLQIEETIPNLEVCSNN